MNANDVNAVVSLYEPEGVIIGDANKVVAGHEAIRAMVAGFLAPRPRVTRQASDVVEAGDLALVRAHLTVAMPDLDGKQTEMEVGRTLVVRRHPGSGWLVGIDRPTMNQGAGAAIPILPAIDLDGTRAFFRTLGFAAAYFSPPDGRGYLIVTRGEIELHFFSHPQLGSVENCAGCYWRVENADALHAEYARLRLPSAGAPSLSAIENKPWGMREFALVDPNGNLVRVGHDL
jgi:uncharacterized protein (TIGR02246 family)